MLVSLEESIGPAAALLTLQTRAQSPGWVTQLLSASIRMCAVSGVVSVSIWSCATVRSAHTSAHSTRVKMTIYLKSDIQGLSSLVLTTCPLKIKEFANDINVSTKYTASSEGWPPVCILTCHQSPDKMTGAAVDSGPDQHEAICTMK